METYFKPLFLALQKRIMENVPEIRFIDQNIGQLGFDEYRAMVSFPAALVDFPSTSFSALSGNAQLGISFIEITLVFAPYSQTYQMAPDNVKDLGLQYFEIEQKVFAALQGWDCEGLCTPLVRTQAQSQNNNDIGMRVRKLTLSTSFEDYTLDHDEYREVEFRFSGDIIP